MADCRRINIISSNHSININWRESNATYDIGVGPSSSDYFITYEDVVNLIKDIVFPTLPTYTGNNGISNSTPTNFQWGGPLIQNTTIAQNGNDIVFSGGDFTHQGGDTFLPS